MGGRKCGWAQVWVGASAGVQWRWQGMVGSGRYIRDRISEFIGTNRSLSMRAMQGIVGRDAANRNELSLQELCVSE